MRRATFLFALSGMLMPLALPASESWLYQSAPQAQSLTGVSASAASAFDGLTFRAIAFEHEFEVGLDQPG